MDRRESLKNLLVGAAATSALFTAAGCETKPSETAASSLPAGGNKFPYEGSRTQWEKERDARMQAVPAFNAHEEKMLDTLADLILPADDNGPAASTTGTTAFIAFMANDYPDFKFPLRAGLAWLSREALQRFNQNDFTALEEAKQKAILDDIAFLPEDETEDPTPEVAFFDLLRKLVLTGYFSSKEGTKDLGYQGNIPNVWDGVPEEVLAKHEVDYDPEWLAKCINQDSRDVVAEWDDDMNLLT